MILELQKALAARGFDPGPIDGLPGKKTTAAVKAFQAANGLVADGIAGKQTWAALGLSPKIKIDRAGFALWAPKAIAQTVDALEAAINKFPELQDVDVLDDWLGQMYVESKGYSTLVESLNYSIQGLIDTFGTARISRAQAEALGRIDKTQGGRKVTVRAANQQAIANIVYGGAWGRANLGNTEPNDGWDQRGSGVKQITGRENITKSGYTANELRTDIFKSVDAAADYFVRKGCAPLAKAGDLRGVTKKVNGGYNGYDDRVLRTKQARPLIWVA